MSVLEDLDESQDHHQVHHGGVKLKTHIGGTEVEDGAEDALEHHADTKSVEDAELLKNPSLGVMILVCLVFIWQDPRLEEDNPNEHQTIDDVSSIADGVIEVREGTIGHGASMVVIAPVSVASVL